jgi:chorismate-pyruvate lyase
MSIPAKPLGPTLPALFALFPPADDVPLYERVAPQVVPPPYHGLLVHEHHMTVTVEAYHGDLVNVRVLTSRQDGDTYARKILLTLQGSGKVVQFGIMRVHLQYCSAAVRAEIVAAQTPLGRILIQHDVLRRIEPTGFLRVHPGPALRKWFGPAGGRPTYGRLAFIHCDGKPAIELLEIVAPE